MEGKEKYLLHLSDQSLVQKSILPRLDPGFGNPDLAWKAEPDLSRTDS